METASTVASHSEVRVPPQNLEAEQSVLGAMLLSRDAIESAVQILREEDFYREVHRRLYRSVAEMYNRGEPVDMITLTNELKRAGDLERVGGVAGLASFVERVPTASNIEYYAQIVREKSVSRQLISAATRVVGDAYADSRPLAEMLDEAERLILEATELKRTQDFASIKDLVGHSFEYVNDLAEHKRHVTGVPTGFYDLDEMTAGLQPANLIVLGARPSVGKTSLALNIAQHVSMVSNVGKEKMGVGFFSLEMTAAELALRMLCSTARINMRNVRAGQMSDSDRTRLSQASGQIYTTPLYIDDTSAMTVLELKAKARRLMRQHPINLLIVDYLQLIQAGVSTEGRVQEVAYVSRQLKALAKDLNIPVMVLSQLSRPQKGQEERRPVLSDLRESGAIEQDADVVIFIHREGGNSDQQDAEHELVIAKQRNGPTGNIPVTFLREYTTFASKAQHS
jgi:replicative DNA helicase